MYLTKATFFTLFISFSLLISSCSSKRNLVYFSDLNDSSQYETKIINQAITIKSGDILSITISNLNPESNTLFNNGFIENNGNPSNTPNIQGYLVDNKGEINFPVIGSVKLEGLNKQEAIELLKNQLSKYIKNAIINIRFVNFKISVIGEVNKPSTFNIQNEKVSVLEALSLAGDLTIYGKRENVVLIREVNQKRTLTRINLNSKSFLNSPNFYLQQNDVLYVEPDHLKQVQASTNTRFLSVVVASATLLTVLLSRLF